MRMETRMNAKTQALSIPDLETVYDVLAQAIDQAGPEKAELFLVKLALLNANALAQPETVRQHIQADTHEVIALHAGQYGHPDQQRAWPGELVQLVAAGRHHAQPSTAVHIDHPHAQLGGGTYRHGRGIGNIVEFQVKEYLEAAPLQVLDDSRAAAGEQLLADLDPALLRI